MTWAYWFSSAPERRGPQLESRLQVWSISQRGSRWFQLVWYTNITVQPLWVVGDHEKSNGWYCKMATLSAVCKSIAYAGPRCYPSWFELDRGLHHNKSGLCSFVALIRHQWKNMNWDAVSDMFLSCVCAGATSLVPGFAAPAATKQMLVSLLDNMAAEEESAVCTLWLRPSITLFCSSRENDMLSNRFYTTHLMMFSRQYNTS